MTNQTPLHFLFFGMPSTLSQTVHQTLGHLGHHPLATFHPAPHPHQLITPLSPLPIPSPSPHHLLTQLAPDLVIVACFPYKIPTSILNIPTHGFINVHPS
ncbi:MAG TPA: hypothetical protein VLL52_14735, partial [Anaerolineae bacterium]|nr:hypothetical protein [Anaerolineae bacterium]